jgi:GntP family gluconate:H+ symporter
MTTLSLIIVLIASVVLLVVLLVKLKMHPVLGLFLASIFVGLTTGQDLLTTLNTICNGFGSTLTFIGIPILAGCVIAMGMQDSGAVISIANGFIRLFRGKRMELPVSITAYIMSIPVFGDVTMILTAPIANVLSKRTGTSMSQMAAWLVTGQFLTHGLVPPTPGILAVTLALGASLAGVIGWGLLLTALGFFVSYLIWNKWVGKEYIPPREDFTAGIEPAPPNATVDELLIEAGNVPNFFAALSPIFMPVIILTISSVGMAVLPADSNLMPIIKLFGDRTFSLCCGAICAVLISLGRKKEVVANAIKNTPSLKGKTISFGRVITDNWIERTCDVAMIPLLVTAMGGSFGTVLKSAPAINELGDWIAASNIPSIIVPFVTTAVIFAACGSMTVAVMTSVGIFGPMMDILGLSPLVLALVIGCGSLTFNHANSSGFWVLTQFCNLDVKQGYKYMTFINVFTGFVCFGFLLIFYYLGILA